MRYVSDEKNIRRAAGATGGESSTHRRNSDQRQLAARIGRGLSR